MGKSVQTGFLSSTASNLEAQSIIVGEGYTLGTGIATATRRNNLALLRQHVALAQSTGKALMLPPGTIEVEIDQTADVTSVEPSGTKILGVRITGAVVIYGAGKTLTTIRVYPDQAAGYDWQFLRVEWTSSLYEVEISDLTIEGDDQEPTGTGTAQQIVAIWAQGDASAGDCALRLHRMQITGNWREALYVQNGDWELDIVDSYLEGNGDLVVAGYNSTSNAYARLHASRSEFVQLGTDATEGVALYIHPNISLRMTDCRMVGTTRYGLYLNGSPVEVPKYVEVTNCHVSGYYGIQGKTNAVLKVIGCTIDATKERAIMYHEFGVLVTGCSISVASGATSDGIAPYDSTSKTGASFVFTNNKIKFLGTNAAAVIRCAHAGTFRIAQNTLEMASTTPVAIAVDSTNTIAHIDGNTCVGAAGRFLSAGTAASTGRFIQATGNYVPSGWRWLHLDAIDNTSKVYLRGNTFLGGRVDLNTSVGAGVVYGEDNYIVSLDLQTSGGAPGAQLLGLRRGRNPATVASGTTITLDPSFDVHHITGTTEIDTIVLGGSSYNLFNGTVTLIADGAWSISDDDNVILRGSAAGILMAANDLITLTYDSTAGKWYQIQ